MRSPWLSIRGSLPKDLSSRLAQFNCAGFGRFLCPKSAKTADEVRVMERGAKSPKYRILCRRACGTCCFRICTNFSAENRSGTYSVFRVSFAKYSTVLLERIERRCLAIGGRRMYLPAYCKKCVFDISGLMKKCHSRLCWILSSSIRGLPNTSDLTTFFSNALRKRPIRHIAMPSLTRACHSSVWVSNDCDALANLRLRPKREDVVEN